MTPFHHHHAWSDLDPRFPLHAAVLGGQDPHAWCRRHSWPRRSQPLRAPASGRRSGWGMVCAVPPAPLSSQCHQHRPAGQGHVLSSSAMDPRSCRLTSSSSSHAASGTLTVYGGLKMSQRPPSIPGKPAALQLTRGRR